MMRSGAVIMRMVSGKTPATNLPQGAVILVVVGRVLITLEAVWEGSGGPGPFTLLAREKADVLFRDCPTLKAIATIFINPL
jgi:hypothetical protein